MNANSPASGPFSTLGTRVAVAVLAIPVIVWSAFEGGYAFALFVAVISTLALLEFYALAEKKGAVPLKLVGVIFGVLVNCAFIYERAQVDLFKFFERVGIHLSMYSQLQVLLVLQLFFLSLVLLIELFRQQGSPIINTATTVVGVMVVSLSFSMLIAIRELFPYGFPSYKFFPGAVANADNLVAINRWGGLTIAAILASIWMCDTAAYFGGIMLGKNKLFERVSPKKTWEGAIAGFLSAVVTMVAAKYFFIDYLRLVDALVLGACVAVFGQLGDLVESRFKRDAEVKDSSAIIPGHGGVYDRFDSLVFVAPILYLYLEFVVLS